MKLPLADTRFLDLLDAWGVSYSWGAGAPKDALSAWPAFAPSTSSRARCRRMLEVRSEEAEAAWTVKTSFSTSTLLRGVWRETYVHSCLGLPISKWNVRGCEP